MFLSVSKCIDPSKSYTDIAKKIHTYKSEEQRKTPKKIAKVVTEDDLQNFIMNCLADAVSFFTHMTLSRQNISLRRYTRRGKICTNFRAIFIYYSIVLTTDRDDTKFPLRSRSLIQSNFCLKHSTICKSLIFVSVLF